MCMIYLSIYFFVFLSVYLSLYLSICLSMRLSVDLSFLLSVYPFINLSTICLSSFNGRRSESTRLPQEFNVYNSKNEQFCKTSPLVEIHTTSKRQKFEPTKCCTCHEENHHLRKPEDLMRQNATPFRRSAP